MWQRFLPYIQAVLDRRGGTEDAERVVRELFLECRDNPQALANEPRVVELAARLRRHETVGDAARAVLAALPRDRAVAVIERYPFEPVLARAAVPDRRDYLARYLGGERGVWNEIVEQALAIVQHDELRAEAYAVAVEIMKRVRANADLVRRTLTDAGAQLAPEATPAGDAELARLVAATGPLPIALDAFYRIVGSIQLAPGGRCALDIDGLTLASRDPLAVRGVHELGDQLARHEERVAASHADIVGPLVLELARGSSVELPPATPADTLDPRVHDARHRLRFVEYLRHSFRWGGFWGLEIPHRSDAERIAEQLRADLVDF